MALLQCSIYSQTLQMSTGVNVILPQDTVPAMRGKKIPVLYLLHGLSDDHTHWVRKTLVERYAEQYQIAVVMPEVQRSFYTDMALGLPYFTYISQELPKLCEELFPISDAPRDRFIAGLSMGGHGALKCALSYPENYAACAAHSAAIDLQTTLPLLQTYQPSFKKECKAIYGDQIDPAEDVFALLQDRASRHEKIPQLFLGCGTEDALYQADYNFYQLAVSYGYDARFFEEKGGHDWTFWDHSLKHMFEEFVELIG